MLNWPERLLFAAALAQLGLTLGLMIRLGFIRVGLVASGKVQVRQIALSNEAWPPMATQVANAVNNQFQLPVLFYLAVLLLWSRLTGWYEVVLAWAFVISRFGHAYIHTTRNRVDLRFFVFAAGFFVLLGLWLVSASRLLLLPGPA